MKRISLLGATGSIGTNCLDVIRRYPSRFRVVALTTKTNIETIQHQAEEFRPAFCAAGDEKRAKELKDRLAGTQIDVGVGSDGLLEAATHPDADIVVNALVGAVGLLPTVRAIEAGKTVALANKESLVMAGSLIMPMAQKHGVQIIPIDSEHSGIMQCFQGYASKDVAKIILTASGGPFLNRDPEAFDTVTPQEALAHPTWDMGPKITIDSATLMNKGLEVIEAHWLFGVPVSDIEVIVHPQSIVHALIQFRDGSMLAQMGVTDMRLPIQYALSYPERLSPSQAQLNLAEVKALSFQNPDEQRFPCLGLAYRAAEAGGTMPTVLNAANETAVEAFLGGRIPFGHIPSTIEEAMKNHSPLDDPSLDEVLEADQWARDHVTEHLD